MLCLIINTLSQNGVKLKNELRVPDDLVKALKKNKQALHSFEAFSYSKKKEYADWIAGIKSEETRKKNIDIAVGWIAEGKIRHWKYLKK